MKPFLWDTSIQGTPPVRGHQIWSQKHFHTIFVVVTVVPLLKGHLYSGERETLPGSRNPHLTSIQGIQGGIQKVTVHKNVNNDSLYFPLSPSSNKLLGLGEKGH